MVKTEQELAYQKVGSWNNGEACLATINALEVGMRHTDVEQIFLAECAIRGNHVRSVIAGMPGGNFPDEELVAGKPFLIDCVSHYKGYMGDIARTFIIGDPPKEVEMRRRANQLAREAVFDAIKPGVKYSTLRQIGLDTMIKAGIPAHAVFVTPHSVGLQHADNPFRMPDFGISGFDHVLQENMVLTVDLPYLEVGYGSGHNEDLFRVTKTGYEPFNTERGSIYHSLTRENQKERIMTDHHKIDRRHLLGGLAATGAALGTSSLVSPVSAAAPALTLSASVPPPVLGPRMNFEQADKIMAELGLDAIVVGAGTNLYQATGLDLTATKMGHTPGVYALITRNRDQRLSLIAPSFLYYYTIAMDHRHSDFPAYLYAGPGEALEDENSASINCPCILTLKRRRWTLLNPPA